MSYFSGLLPALKVVCGPPYLLLKSKQRFKWSDSAQIAWQSLKFLLTMNIKQRLIDCDQPLILSVDASLQGIAMFLSSFDNLALFHISGTSNFLRDSFSQMFAGKSVDIGTIRADPAALKLGYQPRGPTVFVTTIPEHESIQVHTHPQTQPFDGMCPGSSS